MAFEPFKIAPIVALYQNSEGIVGADPMCLPKKAFGIVADSGPFHYDEALYSSLLINFKDSCKAFQLLE